MLQYLDQYEPTLLEQEIVDMYKRLDFRTPYDINLRQLAEEHGIHIIERRGESQAIELKGGSILVFLNSALPWQEQRMELAHELAHIWMHVGRQDELSTSYRSRQETQADAWSMYALAPTFMIANCITNADGPERLVTQLADTFDVPEYWMVGRLKALRQRLYDCMVQKQLAQTVAETTASYDYTRRNPFNPRQEYWIKDGNVVHARMRADI